MSHAQASPEKRSFLLVEFKYGEAGSSTVRYTDLASDFEGYSSVPQMKVEPADNTGTFSKVESKIVLPINNFTDRLSGGVPHSIVTAKVDEFTLGTLPGQSPTLRNLFRGRVVSTIRNFEGKKNVVAINVLPAKSRLENLKMGLMCNPQCASNLFKGKCKVDPNFFAVLGKIDSADGKVVTVTDAPITSKTGRYWRRGYIVRDGLQITIRDWSDADPTKFQMASRVPNDWIGVPLGLRFFPGCDGEITTCRDVFDAEEFFLGLGYAIPAHQPNTETTE